MRGKTNRYQLTFFILVFSVCMITASGQENDTIVPIQKKPEKILKKLDIRNITEYGFNFWQDKFTGHWAGVDFGFNTFVQQDYQGYETEFMKNDIWRSNSTHINIFQQSISLQANRNTIGLVTGLGLHLQSYRLDRNTTIERLPENDIIVPKEISHYDENQKSKLSVIYIALPVLAELQIPINHYDNRLYISAGLLTGVRIGSHTKIKYRLEKKEKLKAPDHYSIHEMKYALMVRTGYRWVNLFFSYDLRPLFKKGKGPELTPLSFGVTLISF